MSIIKSHKSNLIDHSSSRTRWSDPIFHNPASRHPIQRLPWHYPLLPNREPASLLLLWVLRVICHGLSHRSCKLPALGAQFCSCQLRGTPDAATQWADIDRSHGLRSIKLGFSTLSVGVSTLEIVVMSMKQPDWRRGSRGRVDSRWAGFSGRD